MARASHGGAPEMVYTVEEFQVQGYGSQNDNPANFKDSSKKVQRSKQYLLKQK